MQKQSYAKTKENCLSENIFALERKKNYISMMV